MWPWSKHRKHATQIKGMSWQRTMNVFYHCLTQAILSKKIRNITDPLCEINNETETCYFIQIMGRRILRNISIQYDREFLNSVSLNSSSFDSSFLLSSSLSPGHSLLTANVKCPSLLVTPLNSSEKFRAFLGRTRPDWAGHRTYFSSSYSFLKLSSFN